MSKQLPPVGVMTFLNELFSIFDDLAELHGVQKVRFFLAVTIDLLAINGQHDSIICNYRWRQLEIATL